MSIKFESGADLMITSDTEQAWADYRNDVETARRLVLDHEWSRDPIVRAQGMYLIQMLQTFAFHLYLAPRTAFPKFYSQTIFLPFETAFGAPSPDFCLLLDISRRGAYLPHLG